MSPDSWGPSLLGHPYTKAVVNAIARRPWDVISSHAPSQGIQQTVRPNMLLAAGRVHLNKENWVGKGTAIILKGRHVVLQSGELHFSTLYHSGRVEHSACLQAGA